MHFEVWRPWARLFFLEPSAWEIALLVLEAMLALAFLALSRHDFRRLNRRRSLLFLACLAAPLLSARLFVLRFPGRNLLPPPGMPSAPAEPLAPLFGLIPVVVAGAWLGPGPAFLVGLSKGILRAGVSTGSIAAPFHMGLLGFLVGFLLRQDYRGRLPAAARQPLIAVPLMTPFAALILLLSSFAHAAAAGLSGFDYAVTLVGSHFGPALLEAAVAALVVQVAYVAVPRSRPVRRPRRPPPYTRTLNRRLLFLFVPLVGFITIVLVYAVTAVALRLATSQAVDQMARDAGAAAEGIPYFVQTGQSLLAEFAADEKLWGDDRGLLEAQLRRDIRTVVFFDELILLDPSGQSLACYPANLAQGTPLTGPETSLLEKGADSGAPQISGAHRTRQGELVLSFLAPLEGAADLDDTESASRFLMGRTRLRINPMIGRLLQSLQWSSAEGSGFVVDSEGRVVAHPNEEMLLMEWTIHGDHWRIDSGPSAGVGPGWAYESRDPRDNTRQLVYYSPVQGHPWGVVIHIPYEVVLEQARRIATPLLGLQLLLGGGLVMVISLVTNWVTQPLQKLATAADRIAEGDLGHQVEVSGQDEVGRVGHAFEGMRQRLKDRMEALSLLLQVSRAVSGTLDLNEGVPFILEGALLAMDARVARIVFLSGRGEPGEVMARGQRLPNLAGFDRALVAAAQGRKEPLVIGNLRRARSLFGSLASNSKLNALVALPVQIRDRMVGIMWVGFDEARHFDDSDVDLLSTLASQASILVENARLFQTAEGERRRLAAILASTTDAVVVTDRENRILLMNPAAERVFDVRAAAIAGQAIGKTPLPAALAEVFAEPLEIGEALTRELTLADERTLYANLSSIVSADGQHLGRVCVMRDITHLKELDELKSEFVATVSHDLRSPLTYMRGYASMLASVGELNEIQEQYIGKVLRGVTQMSDLVDDLLDLGRVEADVGLEREPCDLESILVEAVESRKAGAEAKEIALRLESALEGDPGRVGRGDEVGTAIVSGDAALLRQAVTNLIDNAIKYTPDGGQVTVGLSAAPAPRDGSDDGARALIHVSDTGIGIAPEDQVRLFEKFYRIKRRDAPSVQGTGLGLSIVKSIVERHDGRVWVESEVNEGSTFTISLPLTETQSQPDRDGRDE